LRKKPAKSRGGAWPGAADRYAIPDLRRERAAYLEEFPLSPLKHALQVMNDETASPKRRDAMAKVAMRYLHARIKTAPLPKPEPQYSLDLSKLSDEELRQYEKILMKASVRVG
jgi:hypothetical protein